MVHGPTRTTVTVPAVPEVQPVDVTGAGNAFCGGFLALLLHKGVLAGGGTNRASHLVNNFSRGRVGLQAVDPDALAQGSVWGSVAASLMIESQGVPQPPLARVLQTSRERASKMRGLVRVQPLLTASMLRSLRLRKGHRQHRGTSYSMQPLHKSGSASIK